LEYKNVEKRLDFDFSSFFSGLKLPDSNLSGQREKRERERDSLPLEEGGSWTEMDVLNSSQSFFLSWE